MIYKQPASLLSYLPNSALIVIDDMVELTMAFKEVHAQHAVKRHFTTFKIDDHRFSVGYFKRADFDLAELDFCRFNDSTACDSRVVVFTTGQVKLRQCSTMKNCSRCASVK